MMKKCSNECEPLCDFCKNYREDEFGDLEDYHSDGICVITGKEVSRTDACEDNFHCFMFKEEE